MASRMIEKICIVYSHHKLGDLVWQLPYIKAISEHHKNKITLVVRKTTQAKDILSDLNYIEKIQYNEFRKKLFYWLDTIKLYNFFKNEKFSHIYILDKINRPAIAAKFSKIKNIIGLGIKNQKKWLTCKNFLEDKDWNLSYSEQSQKFLNINNININTLVPSIIIDKTRLDNLCINFNNLKGDKIAFGVDSFEEYKMWHEEYFVELAEKLFQKKIAKYFYLICGPNNKNISKKIIELSKKEYFIDCSNLNLLEVIKIILDSKFFIGNNSGPLNLSAALKLF